MYNQHANNTPCQIRRQCSYVYRQTFSGSSASWLPRDMINHRTNRVFCTLLGSARFLLLGRVVRQTRNEDTVNKTINTGIRGVSGTNFQEGRKKFLLL